MNYSYLNHEVDQVKRRRHHYLFTKDIETLLYGLGDAALESTTNALEDILQEYLLNLCTATLAYSRSQHRSRIKITDLAFALRNSPLLLSRYNYINEQTLKIDRAKKMLDDFGEDKSGDLLDHDDDDDEDEDGKKKKKKSKKKDNKN